MALAEFPDPAPAAHRHAVASKSWTRARIGELTEALAKTTPVDDPAALADRVALIMEGVWASARALGADGPARQARTLVETPLPGPISGNSP